MKRELLARKVLPPKTAVPVSITGKEDTQCAVFGSVQNLVLASRALLVQSPVQTAAAATATVLSTVSITNILVLSLIPTLWQTLFLKSHL